MLQITFFMFSQIFLSLEVMFICRKSGAISKFKRDAAQNQSCAPVTSPTEARKV